MTAHDLLQSLAVFPTSAPLVTVWATEEVAKFEGGPPFALRTPNFEHITSVSVGHGGGALRLHAESHDRRGGPARTCRGVVTAGQLVETLAGGGDSSVMVVYHHEMTCIEAVASVCAHLAVSGDGGESGYEFEYGDTGQVRVNCESADLV